MHPHEIAEKRGCSAQTWKTRRGQDCVVVDAARIELVSTF